MKTHTTEKVNICFDCTKAVCGCSWSRSFTPVDGWDAKPDFIWINSGKKTKSYKMPTWWVRRCPEFEPDPPREYPEDEEDSEE